MRTIEFGEYQFVAKIYPSKVLAKDAAYGGFVDAVAFVSCFVGRLWPRHKGVALLQRLLFSAFPNGRSGIGLLMLRLVVGITAVVKGVICLPGSSDPPGAPASQWVFCLALIISGSALVIGCLAPLAALVVGVCCFLASFGWTPQPVAAPHSTRFAVLRVAIAVSVALLGPGAYSVDAHLFGRREIVIPRSASPPQL